MDNPLTPETIYKDFTRNKISKNDAINLFISFIEESEDITEITTVIGIIDALSFKSKKIFDLLENLLISDEEVRIRSAAARAIINNYLEELIAPLKWTIEHEKSTVVLKALFDSFEQVDNKYTRQLKKELILSIFGVVEEEVNFFLDLDMICEEFRDMNISFYKDYQSSDINEVKRGKAIYAIIDGHVAALNLSGWALNINSFFSKTQPPSHKKLLNIAELPESLGDLINLEILDLSNCVYLETLPNSLLNLKSLKVLKLYSCASLKHLPKNIDSLISLEVLDLTSTYSIIELPEQIGNLKNLTTLKYSGGNHWFMKLTSLPESIGKLKNLESLNLSDCKYLEDLPESLGALESLQELNLSYCINLQSLPESLGNLKSLKKINIIGCRSLKAIPESLNELNSVDIIRKDDSYIVRWDV